MTGMSEAERKLRARAAAFSLWSRVEDRAAQTAAARAAGPMQLAWHEDKVDPEGQLSDSERVRRAEAHKRAWHAEMAARSARVRRIKKENAA